MPSALRIDCYLSEMCGSYHQLRENIDRAAAELGFVVHVSYHTVQYDEALGKGVAGSPSVWINGTDAFEGGSPGIL